MNYGLSRIGLELYKVEVLFAVGSVVNQKLVGMRDLLTTSDISAKQN